MTIDLAPYVPVLLQLLILVGTIYSIRSARPKQVAEAKQAEAQASLTLVNGFSSLVATQQQKLAEAEAELREERRKAGIVPTLARRCDELEMELKRAMAELRMAKGTIADLEHDT